MRIIIYTLIALHLTSCAGRSVPKQRSDAANQAADNVVHRVYSDMARPPVYIEDKALLRSIGR